MPGLLEDDIIMSLHKTIGFLHTLTLEQKIIVERCFKRFFTGLMFMLFYLYNGPLVFPYCNVFIRRLFVDQSFALDICFIIDLEC